MWSFILAGLQNLPTMWSFILAGLQNLPTISSMDNMSNCKNQLQVWPVC